MMAGMVDDTQWFWAGEYGRDRLLREGLENQAMALAAASRRHRRDTDRIRSELSSMRGSIEARLTALTNAFVAFVELDGIRKELAAFPHHARARRFALEDLQTLFEGGMPPERPDVEDYWLPPAMAALRPDGSIDPDLVSVAHSRDPEVAPQFLAVARAALGAGSEAAPELPHLLAPDDQGTWASWQLIVWATVLRGAFGPRALEPLSETIRPLLAARDDWMEWAAEGRPSWTSEAQALGWVAECIEELKPEGTHLEETGWRKTAAGRPDVRISGFTPRKPDSLRTGWRSTRCGGETDQAQAPSPIAEEPLSPVAGGGKGETTPVPEPDAPAIAEEVSAEDVDGADAAGTTQAMLVKVLQVHINGGGEGEQELLARAEVLEEQFRNPLGASAVPEEVPEERHDVVAVLRQTALDTHASRRDRRWLWGLIGEQFKKIARERVAQPPPATPVEKVPGRNDLLVDSNGLQDPAKLRQLMRQYDAWRPTGIGQYGRQILLGGVAVGGLTLILMFLAPSGAWLILLLAAAGAAYFGYSTSQSFADKQNRVESGKRSLQVSVDRAVASVAEKHRKAVKEHEEYVAAAQRLIAAVGVSGGV